MKGKPTKSSFCGIRLTPHEETLVEKMAEILDCTKSEVFIRALCHLAVQHGVLPHSGVQSVVSWSTAIAEMEVLEKKMEDDLERLRRFRLEADDMLDGVLAEIEEFEEITKALGKEATAMHLLLEIQTKRGWLSRAALSWVSKRKGVSLSELYRAVTFHRVFSLVPPSRECESPAVTETVAPKHLQKA